MDILSIPYHKFLNIKKSDDDNFIFMADERPEYLNHLGNIHACVQLSLAEITSGEFLLNQFYDLKAEFVPVVRRSEAKYHKPANGTLHAKAEFYSSSQPEVLAEMTTKNRALIRIKVEVYAPDKVKALTAIFDWFVQKLWNQIWPDDQ